MSAHRPSQGYDTTPVSPLSVHQQPSYMSTLPVELPAEDIKMEKQQPNYNAYEMPMSQQATGNIYAPVASPPPAFSHVQHGSPAGSPPPQQSQMAYQAYQQPQQPQMTQMGQMGQTQLATPIQPSQPPAPNQIHYQSATPIPSLGMSPAPIDCPVCGQRRMTNVSYHAGNTTHVWAGVTFCLTLCLCFIPYMMNSLKDVQHRCGNCGVHVATWHKSGQVEVHAHS